MFKLSLALLLCAIFSAGASAADLSTVALFNPAAFETPESVQFDRHGYAYASVNSCDPSQLGVWKVTPAGQTSLVAGLPQGAAPNGIAYQGGWLYVADTLLGRVWRIHSDGTGAAEVWTSDSLLTPLFIPLVPGPNGLQVFRGEVYVAVSDRAHVVASVDADLSLWREGFNYRGTA